MNREPFSTVPRVFQWERPEEAEVLVAHLERFSDIAPQINAEEFFDVMGIPNESRIGVLVETTGSITVSAQHQDLGIELLQDAVINDEGQWQLVIHIGDSQPQHWLKLSPARFSHTNSAIYDCLSRHVQIQTVQDVLALKNGALIWQELGDTVWMEFDLTAHSSSQQIYQAYLRRRGGG